jgi:hypothetical protein
MAPDETQLREDLAASRFRVGQMRGKWKLVALEFPVTMFRIRAASRPGSPDWFLMRLDCTGYRAIAPTGQLWDGPQNAALSVELRPFTKAGVMIAFQNWNSCFYHPIDRTARPHWPGQHTDLAWSSEKDIVSYLEVVHEHLNDSQYVVSQAPNAAAYLPQEALEKNTVGA